MAARRDIFDDIQREEKSAFRRHHRGMIIQPGDLRDCILTLPLASFMAGAVELHAVDLVGRSEHLSLFAGRSCLDRICSVDSMSLDRLFVPHVEFELDQYEPLISAFADYDWIATFLGGDGSDFESNLIYTANCSSGTEVASIKPKPPINCGCHVSEFYIRQFVKQNPALAALPDVNLDGRFIIPTHEDIARGRSILEDSGIVGSEPIVLIYPSDEDWPLVNYYGVADELGRLGVRPIFLLGPAELQNWSPEDLANIARHGACLSGLFLAEILAVLACCSGFLGGDNGILHLAGATGLPTMALFTTSLPALYRPLGPLVMVRHLRKDDFANIGPSMHREIALELTSSAGS